MCKCIWRQLFIQNKDMLWQDAAGICALSVKVSVRARGQGNLNSSHLQGRVGCFTLQDWEPVLQWGTCMDFMHVHCMHSLQVIIDS